MRCRVCIWIFVYLAQNSAFCAFVGECLWNSMLIIRTKRCSNPCFSFWFTSLFLLFLEKLVSLVWIFEGYVVTQFKVILAEFGYYWTKTISFTLSFSLKSCLFSFFLSFIFISLRIWCRVCNLVRVCIFGVVAQDF